MPYRQFTPKTLLLYLWHNHLKQILSSLHRPSYRLAAYSITSNFIRPFPPEPTDFFLPPSIRCSCLQQFDPIIAAANKYPLAYSNTFSPTVTILRSRHFLHIRSDYLQEAYFNGPLQFNDFTRYASTISRSCRATRDQ